MSQENKLIYWGLKVSISFAFLSACADRFGLWGASGDEGIAWGNFENFVAYTQILVPWSSGILTTILAWAATIIEMILGILLLTNFKSKEVGLLSGILLIIFGVSMIFTIGPKSVFDYSVFSAAFGALTIYSISPKKL